MAVCAARDRRRDRRRDVTPTAVRTAAYAVPYMKGVFALARRRPTDRFSRLRRSLSRGERSNCALRRQECQFQRTAAVWCACRARGIQGHF